MSEARERGGSDSAGAKELTPRELLRFGWRQLTSMRTALILLLLLAIAAIPGSVIPQEGVDSFRANTWKREHPDLTPIYEKLGLFSVFDSVWFAAIYLLLVISLVGCIVPRLFAHARAWRKPPPKTPRRLERLDGHTSYSIDQAPEEVLASARTALRRYRIREDEDVAGSNPESVSAERGHLREVGNLLFHLALLIVLGGFAAGSLFGYKGAVITVVGDGFSNNPAMYDDFDPGNLFDPAVMEPFCYDVDSFSARWIYSGPQTGSARGFTAPITWRADCPGGSPERQYDLRVNHPLTIGDTTVFLIGHGYAPVITIRDGNGDIAASGPTIFLPQDPRTFTSFGVVKAPDAQPTQIGLTGEFYPTYDFTMETGPFSRFGEALNPKIVMTVYTGDLGMDLGASQSVYTLDTSAMEAVTKKDGSMFRVELAPGESVKLPGGVGEVEFEGVEQWTRMQISRTPGKIVALSGAVLALIGLLMSLFIRPRRIWVRATGHEGGTLVEVAGLDRSGGGDVAEEVARVVEALRVDHKEQT